MPYYYKLFMEKVFDTRLEFNDLPADYQESVDYVVQNWTKNERDCEIVTRYFALRDYLPMSVRELAKMYNLSESRIAQIRDKFIRIVRNSQRYRSILRYGLLVYKQKAASSKNKAHTFDDLIPVFKSTRVNIENDLGLNVATFNALGRYFRKSASDSLTVYDLFTITVDDIQKIRNFGVIAYKNMTVALQMFLNQFGNFNVDDFRRYINPNGNFSLDTSSSPIEQKVLKEIERLYLGAKHNTKSIASILPADKVSDKAVHTAVIRYMNSL